MKPAKAQLRTDESTELSGSQLRAVAADALRRVGSQKAAALSIGISEGRLSTKLKDGSVTLKQLEALGPAYAIRFALDVLEAYGQITKTPKERARERIPEIIAELLEMTA